MSVSLDDTPMHEISGIHFAMYSADEVRKLSVKKITEPNILDALNHPNANGLYDPSLGPFQQGDVCKTCALSYMHCPGHSGHIELSLPVYNPVLFGTTFSILRCTCFFCHSFKSSRKETHLFRAKLLLLQYGLVDEALSLESNASAFRFEDTEAMDEDEEAMDMKRIDGAFKQALKSGNITKENRKNFVDKTTHSNSSRQVLVKEFMGKVAAIKKCKKCKSFNPAIKRDKSTKLFLNPLNEKERKQMIDSNIVGLMSVDESKDDSGSKFESSYKDLLHARKPHILTAKSSLLQLQRLFEKEQPLVDILFCTKGFKNRKPDASLFFVQCLPVPPSRFRPASVMADKIFENPQNTYLKDILQKNIELIKVWSSFNSKSKDTKKDIIDSDDEMDSENSEAETEKFEENNESFEKLYNLWDQLQGGVNVLMDNSLSKSNSATQPAGIRQVLEKKSGLFRMHMMGKRVNHACRSVISPDPYIGTHEIGIPMVFATTLTYPQPVTPWNINELRQAVINGPDVHPGATHVINENGDSTGLMGLSDEQRIGLANQLLTPPESGNASQMVNKKVLRHIKNGDVVLANRQPTLHKPSIMAHQVRVLPGEKTLRLHYANCNTYNADFDGDEMNVHFPQSELARSEAYNIANTDNQYLVPTSGKPLRGLIQDHVGSGAVLTSRDCFLERDRFQQLLFAALPDHPTAIKMLHPAILKPRPMWTGKQLVSTVLLNVTYHKRETEDGLAPGLSLDSTSKVPGSAWGKGCEEGNVIIRNGDLLCGVLDKAQFGASAYGLVHAVQEIYGGQVAGLLLTALGRLFTGFLQYRGLTCGIEDLVLTAVADDRRKKLMDQSITAGVEELATFTKNEDVATSEEASAQELQDIYRNGDKMAGLDSVMKSRLNQLTSDIISTCLPSGQRKPFPQNCLALMIQTGAKGSSVNFSQISCLLGQQELEGRRVPMMISGRSLPSFLPYDNSARCGGYVTGRFLTGIKPQEYFFHCMAGREGLVDTAVKTSRSGYLQRCLIKHLEGLQIGYDLTVRDSDQSVVQFNYGEDGIDVTKNSFLEKFDFIHNNKDVMLKKLNFQGMAQVLDIKKCPKAWNQFKKNAKEGIAVDPVISQYSPACYLGSVSEKYAENMEKFITTKKMDKANAANIRWLSWTKYHNSLAHPGESVGLLAAQSVGEPSTQMTLNTFHFAGFGAMNVTLGIPRLREILMTASENIKTPMMTMPMLDTKTTEVDAANLQHRLGRLTLSQVLENVEVTDWISEVSAGSRYRMYKVRLNFNEEVRQLKELRLSVKTLLNSVESKFTLALVNIIKKTLKLSKKAAVVVNDTEEETIHNDTEEDNEDSDLSKKKKKKNKKGKEDEGESDSDDDDDDHDNDEDATSTKNKNKKTEASSYDDTESEEDSDSNSGSDDEEKEPNSESSDEESDNDMEMDEEALADRRAAVLAISSMFSDYLASDDGRWAELTLKLSANSRKLLLVSMIEDIAPSVVIRSTPGITRCVVNEPSRESENKFVLQTEGVNLHEMWNYGNVIDVNSIKSNDINKILRIYGVEAARATIINEVAGVFKVYGIGVDRRHLSLIADYMTYEGGYKPFNRIGIESNCSPFLKMSFETTMKFIQDSVLTGDFDTVLTPSSRLVVGKPVESGTGSFGLVQPLEQMA